MTRKVKRVDYLVSAMRISLGSESTTPGARTHVLAFVDTLRELGLQVRVRCASEAPGMGRFTRVTQADYADFKPRRVLLTDLVRLGVFLWTGVVLWCTTAFRPAPDLIYERAAVLQNQTFFHARRRRAVTVVEVNGILHKETAQERGMLRMVRLARFMERRVIERADLVVAVSHILKDEILSFCRVDSDRVIVVPNGVERRIFETPDTASDGHADDDFVLGFIGSLSSWQRLDRVLNVVAANRDEWISLAAPRRFRVEIIGDGAQRAALVDAARNLGIDDLVSFAGRLPHDRAIAQASTWRVGLAGHERTAATAMYHSPLKLYEYAALGLDILCTDSADATSLAQCGVRCATYHDDATLVTALRESLLRAPRSAAARQAVRDDVFVQHSWRQRAESVLDAARPDRAPVLRVQLSLAAPDGTTRFVNQVVEQLPAHITVEYFSWRAALLGRYDVFHIHWPEFLIRGHGIRGRAKQMLYLLLLLKLRVTRTPLVRTLHNVEPHDGSSAAEKRILALTDQQTATFIRLNAVTTPPKVAGAEQRTILHGHYKDRFAPYAVEMSHTGRILFCGRIRPYKGIEALVLAFDGLDDDWSLRIVGQPNNKQLAAVIERAGRSNSRITAELRFVADSELAAEVSRAEVVVLPYRELHNSGVALVALSLGRPVIVPDTESTRSLAAEVGDAWVIRVATPLSAASLATALATARSHERERSRAPDLAERDWATVGRRHAEVYAETVRRSRQH